MFVSRGGRLVVGCPKVVVRKQKQSEAIDPHETCLSIRESHQQSHFCFSASSFHTSYDWLVSRFQSLVRGVQLIILCALRVDPFWLIPRRMKEYIPAMIRQAASSGFQPKQQQGVYDANGHVDASGDYNPSTASPQH